MAGRPTDYREEYNIQAYKLCLLGATDKELAKFFEIPTSTLNLWKKANPEFMDSIKRGKSVADAEVANSLFKRATGYQFDEVTYEKIDTKLALEVTSAGEIKADEVCKKKVVTKEVSPDVTAQIFWLKNRKKEKWRDKQNVELTGKDGGELPPLKITLNL
jgi:hypothetical protein